jgi:two-component system response regulator HydG
MTAFGAIESAVEAIKRGAYHYLTKPFPLDELRLFLERALADRRVELELRSLRRLAAAEGRLGGLIGRAPSMTRLFDGIERVAAVDLAVLILGESGTGKELVARAIHERSARAAKPFVAVNSAAIPDQLLESELFGHVRGAFSGATQARRGLFAEADGGTLLLDEIGDMPLPLQAKILRVIETGEVRAVGADQARSVDVRLVAATHQDLAALSRQGTFREDLYFRLNGLTLVAPPLRERPSDVPLLAQHFLERTRARLPSATVREIAPEAMQALVRAPWPGNVRELEKTIERLVVLGARERIEAEDVAEIGLAPEDTPLGRAQRELPTVKELERSYARWVLDRVGGHRAKAAEILGVDVSTLYRWSSRDE